MSVSVIYLADLLTVIVAKCIARQVRNHEHYQKATSIAVYLSTDIGEVRTDELVDFARQDGKAIYIPYCFKQENRDVMTMHLLPQSISLSSLHLNKWNIREYTESQANLQPFAPSPQQDLDLIIVPGLLFDLKGGRLGHGKGYYDYFIAHCNALNASHDRPPINILALSLKEQILFNEQVPMETTDVRIPELVWCDHEDHEAPSPNENKNI